MLLYWQCYQTAFLQPTTHQPYDTINQTNYLHLKGDILYIIHFIIYTVYYLLFLTPWHDMIIRKGKSWWKVSILCTVRLNIIILRDGFSNWGFTFPVLSFWKLGRIRSHKKWNYYNKIGLALNIFTSSILWCYW